MHVKSCQSSVFDSEIIDIDFFPWEQRDILRVGGLTGQELASGDYQDKPQTAPSSLLGLPQNFYFFRELIFFQTLAAQCAVHMELFIDYPETFFWR